MSNARLQTQTKPTHYELTIKTDLEDLYFQGFSAISLDILETTKTITFHSVDLKLSSVSLVTAGDTLEPKSRDFDEKRERVTLTFEHALQAGTQAELRIAFEAKLLGKIRGYCYGSGEVDGKASNYALTMLAPTAARRAFPCWDEPSFKATYSITLISRDDTVSISNMPAVSEGPYEREINTSLAAFDQHYGNPGAGWKVTKFDRTPLMSSYLAAYANGKFGFLESSYVSPLSGKTRSLRTYATPDIVHQTKWCLEMTAKCLPVYETLFDIEYPLPKLDTLIVRHFESGAMENWGLIVAGAHIMNIDPTRFEDLTAQKMIAGVQVHEVAHQWFGNIVTMEWWDNLYLNEGFATLAADAIALPKIHPEWRLGTEFIIKNIDRALELDAKRSSHPIEVECPDESYISQIFDALSYSKAASILRMLANYVTEETFLRGVSIYLKKRLYGNSVTKQLWDGISEAVADPKINVAEMMSNWTSKVGFPVVTVSETEGGIHVRQDRYLDTGTDITPEENETIWHIPLCLSSTSAQGQAVLDRNLVLNEREAFLSLDISKPFKLNAGAYGVYRVSYSPERLVKLGEEAMRPGTAFTVDDRVSLVLDAMTLAKSGHAKTSGALSLVNALRNDSDFFVWNAINTQLTKLVQVWWEQPEDVREGLNAFLQSLFVPIVSKLGFDVSKEDSPTDRQLRTLAITQSSLAGNSGVIQELQARFKHLKETGDNSSIPPDIERVTFQTAIRNGGRDEFEFIKKVYLTTSTPTTRTSALFGITSVVDPTLIGEALSFALEKAPAGEHLWFWRRFSENAATRRALGRFTQENLEKIEAALKGTFAWPFMIKSAFEFFTTKQDMADVQAFFKDKDTSMYNTSLEQSYDSMRSSIGWLERSATDVAEWIKKWQGESTV